MTYRGVSNVTVKKLTKNTIFIRFGSREQNTLAIANVYARKVCMLWTADRNVTAT